MIPIEKRDSYFRIANLYDELEAYDEMGLYASRILDLADNQQDTKAHCYGIFLLAMSQNGRGMLKQAQEGFQNGLSYCAEHGYSLMVAISIRVWAIRQTTGRQSCCTALLPYVVSPVSTVSLCY
ncbi:MAG: hypothetical protein LRY40_05150 [Shewanella fodinae]|nr:hypothetical protein [Shewanella fodinae]